MRASNTISRNLATHCTGQDSERTNTTDGARDRRVGQNRVRRIRRARRLQAIRARRREEQRGGWSNSAGKQASVECEESYRNGSRFERVAW